MSDAIKHECGIALLKLKKPLDFYLKKYGTALYGLNKMYLLMEKQHNRGQDGAGLANIKFDVEPGTRFISRYRSIQNQPIKDIFSYVHKRFEALHKNSPEKLKDFRNKSVNTGIPVCMKQTWNQECHSSYFTIDRLSDIMTMIFE